MNRFSIRALCMALILCFALFSFSSCKKKIREEETETAATPENTVISLPKVDF